MHVQPISFPDSVRRQSVSQSGTSHKKCIGLPTHACGAFKVKSRACVTRVVQRSCQAREHKKYISPPRFVSCCNSLTVMYMDLVLGVYSKVLLQDSCSHQWPLGKFPHSQLCCRHLRPSPYNDSHCVAAPVRYDTLPINWAIHMAGPCRPCGIYGSRSTLSSTRIFVCIWPHNMGSPLKEGT